MSVTQFKAQFGGRTLGSYASEEKVNLRVQNVIGRTFEKTYPGFGTWRGTITDEFEPCDGAIKVQVKFCHQDGQILKSQKKLEEVEDLLCKYGLEQKSICSSSSLSSSSSSGSGSGSSGRVEGFEPTPLLDDNIGAKANGTKKRKRKSRFAPFKKAREYARALRLKSVTEWKRWRSRECRPTHIPCNPDRTYKDRGWVSWKDWLIGGNDDIIIDSSNNDSKNPSINASSSTSSRDLGTVSSTASVRLERPAEAATTYERHGIAHAYSTRASMLSSSTSNSAANAPNTYDDIHEICREIEEAEAKEKMQKTELHKHGWSIEQTKNKKGQLMSVCSMIYFSYEACELKRSGRCM